MNSEAAGLSRAQEPQFFGQEAGDPISDYELDDVRPELSEADIEAQEAYLAEFTSQYAHAMLFANTSEQQTGEPANPGDWQTPAEGWQLRAFAAASRPAIEADCRDFVTANWADLSGLDAGGCGHDFALTRNGHGKGFWDRGLGDAGARLTEACRPYGESTGWFDSADPGGLAHLLDDEPARGDPYADHDHDRSFPARAERHQQEPDAEAGQ